jgi:hypothetical protein
MAAGFGFAKPLTSEKWRQGLALRDRLPAKMVAGFGLAGPLTSQKWRQGLALRDRLPAKMEAGFGFSGPLTSENGGRVWLFGTADQRKWAGFGFAKPPD